MILVVAATELELEQISAGGFACGIGPVEAAVGTARALTEHRPDAILHVGLAGSRTLAPPAVVLGSEARYCDLADAGSTMPRVERVEPDAALLAAARAALPDAPVVPIATTARVGRGSCADVEAMEGFAVLRAAQLFGVPALELRAVSNHPDEADRGKWQFAEALAALAGATERVLAALPSP